MRGKWRISICEVGHKWEAERAIEMVEGRSKNQAERWIVQGYRAKIIWVADWAMEKRWNKAASVMNQSLLGK